MKTKTALLTLAFSLFAAGLCFAANPQMGTWKLNEKKSKLGNGMAKNSTVVYQSMIFQTKVTIDGTDPEGKPMHIVNGAANLTAKIMPLRAIQLQTCDPTEKSMTARWPSQ